jgi:hypothetical protein
VTIGIVGLPLASGAPLAATRFAFSAARGRSAVNLAVAFPHGHPLDSHLGQTALRSNIVTLGRNYFRFCRLMEQRRNRAIGSRVRSRAV